MHLHVADKAFAMGDQASARLSHRLHVRRKFSQPQRKHFPYGTKIA
jgi:hypothetical protein